MIWRGGGVLLTWLATPAGVKPTSLMNISAGATSALNLALLLIAPPPPLATSPKVERPAVSPPLVEADNRSFPLLLLLLPQ